MSHVAESSVIGFALKLRDQPDASPGPRYTELATAYLELVVLIEQMRSADEELVAAIRGVFGVHPLFDERHRQRLTALGLSCAGDSLSNIPDFFSYSMSSTTKRPPAHYNPLPMFGLRYRPFGIDFLRTTTLPGWRWTPVFEATFAYLDMADYRPAGLPPDLIFYASEL